MTEIVFESAAILAILNKQILVKKKKRKTPEETARKNDCWSYINLF